MQNKIEKIISEMTLEEKAAMCTGASNWTTILVERLSVPEIFMADGPHGVRRQPASTELAQKSLPATCFPTASLLASTWDVDLILSMGKAIGKEAIALNVDIVLGPGVNMKRSPLCGRNFEYYSEDPLLAGEMAAAFIEGVQSQGVGTSLKHYAANNQEFQRHTIDVKVNERTLREIYLTAFEIAVKKARPWTVMCSYNKINGGLMSQNPLLLTDILKQEWGFEGMIVSDWWAVRDRLAGLKAGLDLEMPGPTPKFTRSLIDAVKSGHLEMDILDKAVRRVLKTVFRAVQTPKGSKFDVDGHHALARKIAAEGMVLLKNDGILPLKGTEKIAVIGRSAREPHYQGGGSSHINPTRVDMPLDELKIAAPAAEFTWCEGYPADDSPQPEMIAEAVKLAKSAEVALLYIALPAFKESEGYDRPDMDLTRQQVELIKAVTKIQPRTVVILNNGSPVSVSAWINDCAALLEAYMMGQAGAAAIADILFGRINPSGKLAETFPLRLEDTPAYLDFPGDAGTVNYGEGLYIGYRYYDARRLPVSFPFGHGLSYTNFKYSNPSVDKTAFNDVDGVTVTLEVTNTGKVAGREIVQVYVHDHKCTLRRPEKELKGFAKVDLLPGESKKVSIQLGFRAFAFYHLEHHQWITEDGDFDLLIGASSADIRQTLTVTLKSTLDLPCLLDRESTLAEWMQDRRGRQIIEPLYADLEESQRRLFRGQGRYADKTESAGAELGIRDVMDMVLDDPLVNAIQHLARELGKEPFDFVDELLKKVKSTNSS